MEECATCWLENPATIQKQEKQQLLVVGWTIAHKKPRKAIEKESVIQSAPSIRSSVTIQSAGEIVFVGRLKIDIASIYLKDLKVFFEKLKHILIPPPTLGKTTLQLEWNTLHTRVSKLSKGTNMTNQKSYEAIMFQKTSNFIKFPWPNFQCEFIVTKHPSREARQGLVILRKMSPGGEVSHVFVVGTNSEILGPHVQIKEKSIFQSLICSILMIAIGELDLQFSSWWHESTCWFGCFKLSWWCFSQHVHVEQDMFQAHTS